MAKTKHPDILGTKEKEAEAYKKNLHEIRRLSVIYKRVFSTPEGKQVFKDLMELCMVFHSTMTGNSYTYYNEGMRKVGLHILKMREQGWEHEILLMRQEHEKTLTPKEEE